MPRDVLWDVLSCGTFSAWDISRRGPFVCASQNLPRRIELSKLKSELELERSSSSIDGGVK